jgi:ribonuclease HII
VVAAAVVLGPGVRMPGAADSKLLDREAREALHARILARADAVAWAAVSSDLIDRLNILRATHLAMRLAVERLGTLPDVALIDGNPLPEFICPCEAIVGGDARELAMACASIVAKVERDRMMELYDAVYEGYGFASHKGYATPEHLRALDALGPCPIHRLSFAPVRQPSLFALP